MTFWEKEGDTPDYPIIDVAYKYYNGQYDARTDDNIETVNFLRLKQLTIGNNLPRDYPQRIHLQGVRVFFTGENLFLWHNYSGLDPENVDLLQGYDNSLTYPSARKVTIGLTVKF